MVVFLTVLHVIFCFTLIAVILLQAGKGQGLTGPAFGGGNVQSLLGTGAGDFMAKATTVAAICFLLTSIGLDIIEVRKSRSLLDLGRQQNSTLDVDAIKKAIEKIEDEQASGETGQGIQDSLGNIKDEQSAEVAADEIKKIVNEEVSQLAETAASNAEDLQAAVDATTPAAT